MRPLVLLSSLATGGAERVTVSFLRRLAGTPHEAALCTLSSRNNRPVASELQEAGIVHHDLGARRLADPLALVRYLRLLRGERFDLVHAHGQDAWILAAAARSLLRLPLALTRHVLDEPSRNRRERLRARFALAAARRADALIAVSSATADHLSRIARIPRSGIHVIANGIEITRFDRPELRQRRPELRSGFGFEAEERIVLVVSVLREGKGHEVLIESLPMLWKRVPRARLAFAGDGEREAALRALAQRYGRGVVFLGAREDVPELLAACDLVVLPSFAEALPTSLIEAAAAGLPSVATKVGGVPDVVEHERTGLLVPPGSPGALAEAMARVLLDRNLSRNLGERACRRAREGFSLDAQVRKTQALWSEMVAGAPR